VNETELSTILEPLRPALRVHCYRMLGSASDSDDLVQETMLRAWRARDSLADPARVKGWVFRIATNACLDELAKRSRARVLASQLGDASPGHAYPPAAALEDAAWLEPMPDAWLAGASDPAARYTLRESVALAFVAALQVLSPAQRAALLLRDVVGLSAEEAAEALDQSVSATNSVLHRARVAIEGASDARVPPRRELSADDHRVIEKYMQALASHDLDAMIALVHEDLHTTMPPSPTWIAGYADNVVFYRGMFERWGDEDVRCVAIGVNGGLGCAFYRGGILRAIEAIEVADGKIRRMHHFMQPAVIAQFATFLPSCVP